MSNFAETLLGKTIKAIYPEKDDPEKANHGWSERHYEVDEENITCDAGVIIVEFTDGTSMRVWNSEWGGISKP